MIEKNRLLGGDQDFQSVREAKNIFYDRNLRVEDIEGTKPGTIASDAIKGQRAARKRRMSGAFHSANQLTHPYGNDFEDHQYYPEHIRKAK